MCVRCVSADGAPQRLIEQDQCFLCITSLIVTLKVATDIRFLQPESLLAPLSTHFHRGRRRRNSPGQPGQAIRQKPGEERPLMPLCLPNCAAVHLSPSSLTSSAKSMACSRSARGSDAGLASTDPAPSHLRAFAYSAARAFRADPSTLALLPSAPAASFFGPDPARDPVRHSIEIDIDDGGREQSQRLTLTDQAADHCASRAAGAFPDPAPWLSISGTPPSRAAMVVIMIRTEAQKGRFARSPRPQLAPLRAWRQ